jgi:NADH:ubiquinone oxidoreductase subunit 3 (subunit A)
MNKKTLLVIEIIWIFMGIFCLGISIREIIITGFGRAWLFLIMAVASFGLAWLRHSQRKKL